MRIWDDRSEKWIEAIRVERRRKTEVEGRELHGYQSFSPSLSIHLQQEHLNG